MSTSEDIKQYLINHPIDRSKPSCYKEAATLFNVSTEKIRSIYKQLRKKGIVESNQANYIHSEPIADYDYSFTTDTKTMKLSASFDTEIKTLEDLIFACKIDTSLWVVENYWCGKKNGKYNVTAALRKKHIDIDPLLQKEGIMKELYNYSPKVKKVLNFSKIHKNPKLLEISIPDIHFGKLSHKDETGEDYDLKIAEQRFKDAIEYLLSNVNLTEVEKILFPIGNDLINFDNKFNTTTNGTPQSSDSRFHKVLKTVKRILIESINYLSSLAPVDILIVPGNHDETITFTLGEILDAYYYNNGNVTIDNSARLRKYYSYGRVGLQLTHGDKENHNMLGLIFATEQPDIWAKTTYRFCQLGHYHKNKTLNFVSVDEYPGFQIQILPSLSGTDAWHYGKGYMSKKTAKAFLFDKEKGLVAEFNYNL